MACSPGDPDPTKVAMTMMDIPDPTKLLEPKLNHTHFQAVIEKSHPSVAEEDLKPFEEFTESYGQEGACKPALLCVKSVFSTQRCMCPTPRNERAVGAIEMN